MSDIASNPMCRQVWSIPALMREQYAVLEATARTLLATPEIFSIQQIILTGCGDSYAAAFSAKQAFEQLTEIPTEVVEPLAFARCYPVKQIGFAPQNPLVVAISNSGSVARVAECVQFANAHGAFTIGLTSKLDSPLGAHAQWVFKTEVPPFEPSPGVRSYAVSIMALLLLAIRIGEVRGCFTMDRAAQYRAAFGRSAEELDRLLPQMDTQVKAIAKHWRGKTFYDFIGSGADYAAAFYGHAKVLEATGLHAACVDAEEWMHLNFFARDVANTGTVMIAGRSNPAISRALETAAFAARLGRPLLVVSDGQTNLFPDGAELVCVPHADEHFLAPLTQYVPLALFSGYLCEELGEEYGRGCKGPWQFAEGGAGVRNSRIIIR